MSNTRQDQNSDGANGDAAAGTKGLSKPAELLTAATIQDGGASNKGYKQPTEPQATP